MPGTRRQLVAFGIVLAVVSAALAGRTAATVDRPAYASGDFWTYRTNLTEALNLSFTGNTTLEAGTVGPHVVQGVALDALELYLSGGGTFAGSFPFGEIRGNWTVTGADLWETRAWRPVNTTLRLTAEGELRNGPAPIRVALELVNVTTQRVLSDGFTWPVHPGSAGSLSSRWNVSENLTILFQGSPPQSNETRVNATLATQFEDLRSESVSVPAGTFDADVIREAGPDGGYRLRWFAPRVGNDAREEDYNATGARVATSELTAFRYAAGEPAPPFPWLPVLVAALAVVVVLLFVGLALRARKRRVPEETWMPPEVEGRNPPSP